MFSKNTKKLNKLYVYKQKYPITSAQGVTSTVSSDSVKARTCPNLTGMHQWTPINNDINNQFSLSCKRPTQCKLSNLNAKMSTNIKTSISSLIQAKLRKLVKKKLITELSTV